jgi:triacylglycerol esterase/lipase EstA (alpha/beta hydrolase family)
MGGERVRRGRRAMTIAVIAAAMTASITACSPPPADPITGRLPVAANFNEGLLWALRDPLAPPVGANNWACRPTAAHPEPVILAHGVLANMADTWQAVSPSLVNAGYCVFALNYGGAFPTSFFNGTNPVEQSAIDDFGPFVDKVLATTGATQVDLVGHSEGTVMPRYWQRYGPSVRPDGRPKIHRFVGIAPATGGSTFYGLTSLVDLLDLRGTIAAACGACADFVPGSAIIEALHDPAPRPGQQFSGETQPAVSYTMLATRFDNIVMPYRSGFLEQPGPHNITIQDSCGVDYSDHLGMVYDPITIQLMLNALDPRHPVAPPCFWVPPVFGIDTTAT